MCSPVQTETGGSERCEDRLPDLRDNSGDPVETQGVRCSPAGLQSGSKAGLTSVNDATIYQAVKHSSIIMKMRKKTIHRIHWNGQLIEVIDEGDNRSLLFGGSVLQSAMSLSAPHNLALSYTRYMMASLLLDDEPKNILIVGVGAGSLLRFLHHHFPEARIDGTDISASVIDLASHFFHLPKSTSVAIHCCDGRDFLHQRKAASNYDLILIDAFDAFGMSDSIYNAGFFGNCLDHLSINGIVSLNLWSGDQARMEQVATEITEQFESLVELPVPNRGNVICLAGRGDIASAFAELDGNDILQLQKRFNINFQEIFRVFKKYNLSFIKRLSSYFN